jgi:3-isopropylmalate/(R)-2-methylmalate dehydratase large subunit
VRCIIIPGTQAIYLRAVREGLAEIFVEAGAAFSTPTCGPCLGGHMGVLAAGERSISPTNRNFVGRMGHIQSEVYLSGPAVAAASAVLGYIGGPEQLSADQRRERGERGNITGLFQCVRGCEGRYSFSCHLHCPNAAGC